MDNKIKIPWYKVTIKGSQGGSGFDTPSPNLEIPDFRKPRKPKRNRNRTRQRQRQRERVRERVRENVREREPSRVPNRYPILDPRQQPNPKEDYGDNPYREPGMNPLPLPIPGLPSPSPDTRRDPGATPGVNQKQPTPQTPFAPSPNGGFALPYEIPSIIPPPGYKTFTPQQEQWGNDFITNVEFVSRITGIQAKMLYTFMRDYDYENGSLPQFTNDAQAQFGAFGGAVLATIIAGKMLGEMWGKRALNSFAPVIKLDDEYMQDYFGTQIY